jgi:hypothetical protein
MWLISIGRYKLIFCGFSFLALSVEEVLGPELPCAEREAARATIRTVVYFAAVFIRAPGSVD